MVKTVSPEQLGAAIAKELTLYTEDVTLAVNRAGERAARELLSKTRATAPVGYRGKFAKSIAVKVERHPFGNTYTWYVKPPNHRLTHLLVHGHATKDGGRTRSNPFLTDAMDAVLPKYEQEVREILQNGG